jgi:hypothetical protein
MPEKKGVNPPAAGAFPKWKTYQSLAYPSTVYVTENDRAIAEMYPIPPSFGLDDLARGRLMAAAPDLYEALEGLLCDIQAAHLVGVSVRNAVWALRKARGENATGALPAKPEKDQKGN